VAGKEIESDENTVEEKEEQTECQNTRPGKEGESAKILANTPGSVSVNIVGVQVVAA